jgi:hypothetical protein
MPETNDDVEPNENLQSVLDWARRNTDKLDKTMERERAADLRVADAEARLRRLDADSALKASELDADALEQLMKINPHPNAEEIKAFTETRQAIIDSVTKPEPPPIPMLGGGGGGPWPQKPVTGKEIQALALDAGKGTPGAAAKLERIVMQVRSGAVKVDYGQTPQGFDIEALLSDD